MVFIGVTENLDAWQLNINIW